MSPNGGERGEEGRSGAEQRHRTWGANVGEEHVLGTQRRTPLSSSLTSETATGSWAPKRAVRPLRLPAADNVPLCPQQGQILRKREFFIDNLLVQIHFIIVMIRWTGLAPWEFEFQRGQIPTPTDAMLHPWRPCWYYSRSLTGKHTLPAGGTAAIYCIVMFVY